MNTIIQMMQNNNFVSLSLWSLHLQYWLDGKSDKTELLIFGSYHLSASKNRKIEADNHFSVYIVHISCQKCYI